MTPMTMPGGISLRHTRPLSNRQMYESAMTTGRMMCVIVIVAIMSSTALRPTFAFPILPQRHGLSGYATMQPLLLPTVVSSVAVGATDTDMGETGEREEEVDVVVVGAGVGGLSCAALSSKYGLKTLCLEAHDTPGGCAHSFDRYSSASQDKPFRFDAGPSLVSGLSRKSTNPLRQVLDAIGTADSIEWCLYDGWIVHDTADGKAFRVTTGDGGDFERAIETKAGSVSRKAFEEFKGKMLGPNTLSDVSAYIPPFALRGGIRTALSLSKYLLKFLSIGTKGSLLTGPFTECMDLYGLKDPFVKKWFDYLAFALSGEDAAHTQAAAVAYMMMDLHKKDAVLDYPMGGMDSIIQALVQGMQQHGGELRLNSLVDHFWLEDDRCVGVVLADGTKIRAKKGVVSNSPIWNTVKLLPTSTKTTSKAAPGTVAPDAKSQTSGDSSAGVVDGAHAAAAPFSPKLLKATERMQQAADAMSMTGSFMHLHLGIPSDGLPDDLECHHSVLDMDRDVRDEQNMVIISIPTVFDPSLAPPGYHIVHAYTAASDSFDEWEKQFLEEGRDNGKVGVRPNSSKAMGYKNDPVYQELKDRKAEALWKAIERVIPDVRERAQRDKGSVVLVGTPMTHRRYNQRFRGTYGPGPSADQDVWQLQGATTAIDGLLLCGDTSFPGIGLPGVAASGTIAANTLVSVSQQMELMEELKQKGALQ